MTIPIEIRERLGLHPHSEVEFEVVGNSVRLRKVRRTRKASRGRSLVTKLRGQSKSGLSTDEIMELTRGRG